MSVTTVKLKKTTKSELDNLRDTRESYDDVVHRLIMQVKEKGLKHELVEGYKNVGKDERALLHEWEPASSPVE